MKPTADHLEKLAAVIRNPHTDRGLLARVRRSEVRPDGVSSSFEVQALLFKTGLDPADAADFLAWALVCHCLAIVEGSHSANASTGEELARIPFSEMRMRVLMEADLPLLFDLLPRLARRVARKKTLNWWLLAKLVLFARGDPAQADEARRHLIAGYLRATAAADA